LATDKSGWVVGHVLARQARQRGDQPFIQFEDDDPLTYAEFDLQCNRVGNAFAEVGIGFGDRVAIIASNRLEYLWTWIGLSRIGAVAVAVNTAYKGRFLTHVLTNAEARMGVVEREFLAWLAEIEDDIPALATVYVPGPPCEPGEAPAFKRIELRAFEELLGAAPDAIQREVSYRDTGLIMFTSGTTGPSKGVLMPHGHLFLFGLNMQVHMRLSPEDRYYICMPLFHAQGLLMQFYGILQAGGYAILARQFRASTWIDEVRKHRATVTNTLGVMTDFVLRQPPKPSDRDNQLRLLCAVPVTADTLRALRQRFGIPKFNELFGMTECNLPVARPLDAPDDAGCSGKIWDEFFEVIIADPETDEPLPVGTVGEILVRPKEPFCFMQGYNGMPDRTVETWRNFWFHTGDAGRIDERGYLWYIDRIKDTIRRRGENISSYEVEAVLLEYPGIAEVAAVAVKADEGGEDEVLVCLVLEAGAELPDPIKLLDFCVERMPYFAVPRYIEVVDEIPKTPSQKIQKNKLRERGLSASTWDRESVGYRVRRR
jgi:crotonobetaine/carnitine-CoA ligase